MRAYVRRFPWRRMLGGAKWRAKKQGLPFNLTAAFLERVCAPGVCVYCEEPVVFCAGGGSNVRGARPFNAGELDRVDPALGYVKGNVVLACSSCNGRKSDMLPIHLRWLADRIEAAMKDRVIRR
jgi:hypothetical protein